MSDGSLAFENLLPRPAVVSVLPGHFQLPGSLTIAVGSQATSGNDAAIFLRRQLALLSGQTASSIVSENPSIRLQPSASPLGGEEYVLTVSPAGITIEASAPAGWFYGAQTLLQLLAHSAGASLTCVRIHDKPRFAWRGLMLDVVRHFMPVDGLLRLLDNMAFYKLNVFHWHLTDDQGWRVESHRYPRLTKIGAWRKGADGVLTPGDAPQERPHAGQYGGFYTHDDIRKVVDHAATLHIQVVPEIEMPGHAVAALAAYPELSCAGGAFEPATRTGVFKDVYCVGNDATFDLLEGFLDEILPLFPGEYVHVGGDECPRDRWRACPKCQARIQTEGLHDEEGLQSYMIRRMEKFLASRNKKLIGWDEILEGGLAPGATVMSWRGIKGGLAAARSGHDVVMTPNSHLYLDYRQAPAGEPYAIGSAVTTLEKTYSYDPIPPELQADQSQYILGLQGNVWTEYMPNMSHVEYMIWPRAAAIAEIGWSPADKRDFEHFRRRVKANEPHLTATGSKFRAS